MPCHATRAAQRTQRTAAQQVHSCSLLPRRRGSPSPLTLPPHPPPLASGTAGPNPGIACPPGAACPYPSNGMPAGKGAQRHPEGDVCCRMSGKGQPGREEAASWHGRSPSPRLLGGPQMQLQWPGRQRTCRVACPDSIPAEPEGGPTVVMQVPFVADRTTARKTAERRAPRADQHVDRRSYLFKYETILRVLATANALRRPQSRITRINCIYETYELHLRCLPGISPWLCWGSRGPPRLEAQTGLVHCVGWTRGASSHSAGSPPLLPARSGGDLRSRAGSHRHPRHPRRGWRRRRRRRRSP